MIDPFRTATPATLWQSDSSTTSRRPAALLFCVHSLRLTIRDSRSPMMKSFLFGNDQVAFYDDGVGTSMFKPWAIPGGAFSFGLKRNVIDICKFGRPRRLQDSGQHQAYPPNCSSSSTMPSSAFPVSTIFSTATMAAAEC
jgi:hypothetical protein